MNNPATDAACWQPVIDAAKTLLGSAQRPVLISIDGCCGSGKSALAGVLASLFPSNVFHMDDYYLPMSDRAEDWQQQPAGNMDLQRFLYHVLRPAAAGQAVVYQRYSCAQGAYAKPVVVQPQPLCIVEGSYSQHPMLCGRYALNVFLQCSPQVQRRRLKAREGERYPAFEKLWMPMEQRYFTTCRQAPANEIRLNTDELF